MFGARQVGYLGHMISEQGMMVDPAEGVDWPILQSAKGLRVVLGLMGYYQKFIVGYGKI